MSVILTHSKSGGIESRVFQDNIPYIYDDTLDKWISEQFFIIEYSLIYDRITGKRFLEYNNSNPSSNHSHKFLEKSYINKIYFFNDNSNISGSIKLQINSTDLFNFILNNEKDKTQEVNIYIEGSYLYKNLKCLLETSDEMKNIDFRIKYHLYI